MRPPPYPTSDEGSIPFTRSILRLRQDAKNCCRHRWFVHWSAWRDYFSVGNENNERRDGDPDACCVVGDVSRIRSSDCRLSLDWQAGMSALPSLCGHKVDLPSPARPAAREAAGPLLSSQLAPRQAIGTPSICRPVGYLSGVAFTPLASGEACLMCHSKARSGPRCCCTPRPEPVHAAAASPRPDPRAVPAPLDRDCRHRG